MRRYELRILPLGRRGTFLPFDQQYHGKTLEIDTPEAGGISLRFVRSRSMGRMVTIRGMIVRATDVKPSCVVATYTCDACGCEVYQVVEEQTRIFTGEGVSLSGVCSEIPNQFVVTAFANTREQVRQISRTQIARATEPSPYGPHST
jgi:DNA replicative helicase MCM subunit Mcm2 (Cdc46/Mcm family)